MITHSRVKTHQDGQVRNYVSFFQSVTTIGIMTRAKSSQDAENQAKRKLSDSDFTSGLISQTPYALSGTDEWQDEINPTSHSEVAVEIGSELKNRIASKLGVTPENLSDAECTSFINRSLQEALTK